MKKIIGLILTLAAVHFVAVVAAAGYLLASGRLSRDNTQRITEILFPPPASQPASQPATQPVATTRPLLKLEELLAKQAGRPATEQVDFIRNAFDEQMGQLERRLREMEDLQRTIEAARDQLARDRVTLAARQKTLDERESEAARIENDAGFQAELQLYTSMPPEQVKRVFLGLDDQIVARYLQAMPPRTASKIIREFESPEEMSRLGLIFDRIRRAGGDVPGGPASAQPGGTPIAPQASGN